MLWQTYGDLLTKSYRKITGANFRSGVRARVGVSNGSDFSLSRNGWSYSGKPNKQAMILYCSSINVPDWMITWQLCHELAHRLVEPVLIDRTKINSLAEEGILISHRNIFIFIVEVFREALPPNLNEVILVNIDNNYYDKGPYFDAWTWARSLTFEERQVLTKSLFKTGFSLQSE